MPSSLPRADRPPSRHTFMIVAPSLLIVVPRESCISLSMPSGPWRERQPSKPGGGPAGRGTAALSVRRSHQRRAHGIHDNAARVYVADQLRFALRGVRALLEQDDLRLTAGAWAVRLQAARRSDAAAGRTSRPSQPAPHTRPTGARVRIASFKNRVLQCAARAAARASKSQCVLVCSYRACIFHV